MARRTSRAAVRWHGPEGLRPLLRPVAELRADPDNVRVHGTQNHAGNRGSMERVGQYLPLGVRAGVVMIGNDRLACAQELGWTHVAVVDLDHLDEQQVRALAIADNKLGELGEWNTEALQAQLQDLDAGLRTFTGFSDNELRNLSRWAPAAPEGSGRGGNTTTIWLTNEQAQVVRRAMEKARVDGDLPVDTSDGRLLELLAGDYLAGA